ncbi:hypothetical protein B0A52_08439 [Exophiala mesophila]|uniref:Dicer-like protein 2 n=1 Tax=Exophiala mesophila TaxID=212818 RepID=A0A438MWA1_EXOME|nr:hypothetical protein B0A52_08439 [Exophiala mesophila]
MSSSTEDFLDWSGTSSDDEDQISSPPLQSRAYQIEIFEKSMRENIIAMLATGSGKTQIAKLRIEAELQKSVDKLVWFTAPSVVLAIQQHSFLSQQLPAFNFRLVTGQDNADYWDQSTWDRALLNINTVISTPQILLDALDSGFLALSNFSLIVVDEAHHCFRGNPLNTMMTRHYHTMAASDPQVPRPHILGLSASPVSRKSTLELKTLEANLNARCVTPTVQVEDYSAFVNMPSLEKIAFVPLSMPPQGPLLILENISKDLQLDEDPHMINLRQKTDLESRSKVERYLRKGRTPTIEDIRSFALSAGNLNSELGTWAAQQFIVACLKRARLLEIETSKAASSTPNRAMRFVNTTLDPIRAAVPEALLSTLDSTDCSDKVNRLVQFLKNSYSPAVRVLIFVKTRYTAWALSRLINCHPLTTEYHAFSFVGCANGARSSFMDLAHLQGQNKQLEDFRRGELNLCVATSVMEEGVDVPAMNLVICFDEPANIRSYIQSRGRARHRMSKFVLFHATDYTSGKMLSWPEIEEEMKRECADSDRAVQERLAGESEDEAGAEIFRVSGPNGGTLTYDNAVSRLQRFCHTWSRSDDDDFKNPVYRIEESQDGKRAFVHLPLSLNVAQYPVSSKLAWKTEKMARRDAAFQAYKLLYAKGLLSHNLLPDKAAIEKDDQNVRDDNIEKRESVYTVEAQYDPWPDVTRELKQSASVYAHRLRVQSIVRSYPRMVLILPKSLQETTFTLWETSNEQLLVTIEAGKDFLGCPTLLVQQISFLLLNTIMGRRLKEITAAQVPLLLIPDLPADALEQWYQQNSGYVQFADAHFDENDKCHEYLISRHRGGIPEIYEPFQSQIQPDAVENGDSIKTTPLSKRLNHLSAPEQLDHGRRSKVKKAVAIEECYVLNLRAEYARIILLAPSITHMVEIALRTLDARQGPLADLPILDLNLLRDALTTPSASISNYQRLEFLGDSLLKYFTAVQVFVDHPHHPESQLTVFASRIVTNARLQRATRELGLDKHITRHAFKARTWRAGVPHTLPPGGGPKTKNLSSKILADVVEALIGAAYTDGVAQGLPEENCLSALKVFLPEISWASPKANIARFDPPSAPTIRDRHTLSFVESMIGYEFQRPGFLAEALTHSAYGTGIESYDRLEFLGDAVLDMVVKARLYDSPQKMDPAQMSKRRHALVSHSTLAFFALQTKRVETTIRLNTNPHTKKTTYAEDPKFVYLPDYIQRVGSRESAERCNVTLERFLKTQKRILDHLLHGKTFPWGKLLHLNAPKSYSDMIESILGAIFIDAGGDLMPCVSMLEKIGYLQLVDRYASEVDIDANHPQQVFSMMSAGTKLESRRTKTQGWQCKAMVGGELLARCRGASCKEEAECRAARRAVKKLAEEPHRKRKRDKPDSQSDEETGSSVDDMEL